MNESEDAILNSLAYSSTNLISLTCMLPAPKQLDYLHTRLRYSTIFPSTQILDPNPSVDINQVSIAADPPANDCDPNKDSSRQMEQAGAYHSVSCMISLIGHEHADGQVEAPALSVVVGVAGAVAFGPYMILGWALVEGESARTRVVEMAGVQRFEPHMNIGKALVQFGV